MSKDFAQAGWATQEWQKPSANKLAVFFQRKPVLNNKKTEDLGREVYDSKIFITKVPADQFLRVTRPIRASDKKEFPEEWARFEQTGESKIIGYPVEHWIVLSDTQKMEFKSIGCQTVEQIANLTDIALQTFMGGKDIRQKARLFLEALSDPTEMVAKIKAESAAEVDAMKQELEKMKAQMAAFMEANTKPEKVKA